MYCEFGSNVEINHCSRGVQGLRLWSYTEFCEKFRIATWAGGE